MCCTALVFGDLLADDQKPSAGEKRAHSDMSADNVTNMISVTKQMEEIYVSQRVEDLDQITSGKVSLHKDSITLGANVQGIDNLKKYFQVDAYMHAQPFIHACTALLSDKQSHSLEPFPAGLLQEV